MANIKLGGTIVASESSGTVTLNSATVVPAAGITGTLGSGVFPAGHIIKTHHMVSAPITTSIFFNLSTTFATVEYSSPAITMQITGITATEGNLLHIEGYGGTPRSAGDGSHATMLGYIIDGVNYGQGDWFNYGTGTGNDYGFWNGHVGMLYTVPASFTNKTISLAGSHETPGGSTHAVRVVGNRLQNTVWMIVQEIQQ